MWFNCHPSVSYEKQHSLESLTFYFSSCSRNGFFLPHFVRISRLFSATGFLNRRLVVHTPGLAWYTQFDNSHAPSAVRPLLCTDLRVSCYKNSSYFVTLVFLCQTCGGKQQSDITFIVYTVSYKYV